MTELTQRLTADLAELISIAERQEADLQRMDQELTIARSDDTADDNAITTLTAQVADLRRELDAARARIAELERPPVVTPPLVTSPPTGAAWNSTRNAAGNLVVNGGTAGTITFLNEYRNSYPREGDTSAVPLDRVAYDWTVDGYNGQPLGSFRNGGGTFANADLAHPAWKDSTLRHVLIKNWHIKNAYKTIPGPHVDVTQVYDGVGWGGWFACQDSQFKNSDDGIVQWQFGQVNGGPATFQGRARADVGGVLIQGVTIRQEAAFVADANARVRLNGDQTTVQGNHIGTWDPAELWLVNVVTDNWFLILQQRWTKVVVIGTVPSLSYRSGDAYAFSVVSKPAGGNFFQFPTIEAALAAGHAEPPFIRLSRSGWADPAANAPLARAVSAPAGW